ncbi:biotin synthase BioB [Desulfoluna spongiiphila]|uniref:Biotin synthase n=1 Tax=Desulfoluna spongiiphila TaxID=419481 RepID=A0A1G5AY05_9BACT|nr:biotin synthase BioB [Desulfoluna spongiiphila]SCX82747.1 biotin synthase [Desulfoluna spongiiphila]
MQTHELIRKLIADPSCRVSEEDALALAGAGHEALFLLFEAARVRCRESRGDTVFLCSIVNAKSGKCSQDCAFCAQSSSHETGVDIYPLMDEETLVERGHAMARAGATRFGIVTSGHSLNEAEIDRVCRVTERLRKETDLTICGSLGMLDAKRGERLRSSGMGRYHHNLETSRSHFDAICTTHTYDEDIETVQLAADMGFGVCSGGILGMGESWAQRVELALTLRDLNADTIPMNFLTPVPGTRMANRPLMPALDALKSVALFRLIAPEKRITVCGGREVTLRDFQSWLFPAGADGLMVGNYLTTAGRSLDDDLKMVTDAGLLVGEV